MISHLGEMYKAAVNTEPKPKNDNKPDDEAPKAPTTRDTIADPNIYKKLDRMIKSMDLNMKMKTGKLPHNGLITGTIGENNSTIEIILKAEIYGGIALFSEYNISGTPTSYNIKAPLSNIAWVITDIEGNEQIYTFRSEAIAEFQKDMLKSETIKDMFTQTNSYTTGQSGATQSQAVFLPFPSFLVDSPVEVIGERLLPIRVANACKLRLTFESATTKWCDFTGGTTPAITLASVPELRYSNISSATTKKAIYDFYKYRCAPVYSTETRQILFTASGTAHSENLETKALTTSKKFVGCTIKLCQIYDTSATSNVDTARMEPIELKTSSEMGLYKGEENIMTGTSNAIKLKTLGTFDCLPSDGDSTTSYHITPLFVSASNPFSISNIARDFIFTEGTDYVIRIPTIASGLISTDKYEIRVTIFNLQKVYY